MLQVAGRRLHDQSADLGGSGEGDLVNTGVSRECCPGRFAKARDDVHHARRQAGLLQNLAQAQRGERRLFRHLQYHRAAGGEGRSQFPRRHQQRKVPGDDLSHDADGLGPRVRVILDARRIKN